MKFYAFLMFFIMMTSCSQKAATGDSKLNLDKLAERYVRLGLSIGQYDADFVDAYYGPDSLKPTTPPQPAFPADSFVNAVRQLSEELQPFTTHKDDGLQIRSKWMRDQLTAFDQRIRMFAGNFTSFDEEARLLFGVKPPTFSEQEFQSLVTQLDQLLPGDGSINERFQSLTNKFVIPREKLDTVLKAAINESRQRTKVHYELPANEAFHLEYVNDKPWSGYNWYQGNYQSLIQFNTDITTSVERVIDIASHEGYPGHHVYNMLLEKHLYRDRGYVEASLYPLFSPQSLIAEGSANYGISVAFPGDEKIVFTRTRLLPLAGIDTSGLNAYFQALEIKGKLKNVSTEVTRRLLDNKINEQEAIRWLTEYALMKEADAKRSIAFSRKYRSYVINYAFGQDLVKNYVESKGGTASDPAKRWEIFYHLLSNQVRTSELSIK